MKKALLLAFFLAALVGLLWMLGLPYALRSELESRAGVPVAIESATGNPFSMAYRISGAKVGSADAGDASSFISIAQAEFQLGAPSKAVPFWRVENARVEIDKLVWTIDENGRPTLAALEAKLFESFGMKPEQAEDFFQKLDLKIGEVEVLDFSKPIPRRERLAGNFEIETAKVSGLSQAIAPYIKSAYR